MIKAIIFDCFGVLVINGVEVFERKYLNNDPSKHTQVRQQEDLLNSGKIDLNSFVINLAKIGNVSAEETQKIIDDNPPDDELFDFIRTQLKPKYKIGLLSNAGDDWLEEMAGADNKRLFDAIVLSYKYGFIKPQPQIYQQIIDDLGVNADECIMIDDNLEYCDGAKNVGMHAIRYKTLA